MATAGISGFISGTYNYAVLKGSFFKGFAAGFIGGAVGYVSGGLIGTAFGNAIGAGLETGLMDRFEGKQFSMGKVAVAMLASGLFTASLGDRIQEGLTALSSGIGRRSGSFAEMLARQGIDAEELGLDATIALCQNFGVGVADLFYGAFYACLRIAPGLTTVPIEP